MVNRGKLKEGTKIDDKDWRLEIFQRGTQSDFSIAEHCNSEGIAGEVKNGRFHSEQKFKFNSSHESVAKHVKNWV